VLEKKTRGRGWIQMIDDLIGSSFHTDLKITAFGKHEEETVINVLYQQFTERRCTNIAVDVTIVVIKL